MKKRNQKQKILNANDELSLEEINKKLDKVLSEGITPPTKEELEHIDSLDAFFKKQEKEGKCLLWRCPICGKPIREITSSGQIKDLLVSFQKDTWHINCRNKHRNWFYLERDTLIFKAVINLQDIEKRGEKWFALTSERYKKR